MTWFPCVAGGPRLPGVTILAFPFFSFLCYAWSLIVIFHYLWGFFFPSPSLSISFVACALSCLFCWLLASLFFSLSWRGDRQGVGIVSFFFYSHGLISFPSWHPRQSGWHAVTFRFALYSSWFLSNMLFSLILPGRAAQERLWLERGVEIPLTSLNPRQKCWGGWWWCWLWRLIGFHARMNDGLAHKRDVHLFHFNCPLAGANPGQLLTFL